MKFRTYFPVDVLKSSNSILFRIDVNHGQFASISTRGGTGHVFLRYKQEA